MASNRARPLVFASLATLACAGAPKHPPASGPVGATGTCWASVSVPTPEAGAPPDPNDYGYHFEDTDGPRVSFVIKRGVLRDVGIALDPTLGFGPDDALIVLRGGSSQPEAVPGTRVQHGRASGLHLPLLVGEWAAANVVLTWTTGPGDPVTSHVRMRVLGDDAEVDFGGRVLKGQCVWGRVDPDSE